MSPVASPTPTQAPQALRHRRSARRLTTGQLASFRAAVSAVQGIGDDRGFQSWAGIHGLPLPISCTHHNELFLPWHRAYLYLFEKALQDQVPGVTLPWWDWTDHTEGFPAIYTRQRADNRRNPLFDSPIQPGGRERPSQKRTTRAPGPPSRLPTSTQVQAVLDNHDFLTFQTQLESIHNGVHGWIGGTMNDPRVAAYDPIFWAHHTMVDRLWSLWQVKHSSRGPRPTLWGKVLRGLDMTVEDVLDTTALGYDYAASTVSRRVED